jgi:tetratricopeptide (TPR) repeat protein
LLFVDTEGKEVDRIIGFLPPTEYLLRIEDIVKKRNTLSDYLTRYNQGVKSADIIAAIAMKYEDRKENEKAAEFYSILISDFPDPTSEYYKKGKFFLASHEFIGGNENALRNYVSKNSGSPFCMNAYRKMVYHYADTEQIEKELSAYSEMLSLFPDDPGALNSYAWRMAEIETNLNDALIKVRKAIIITTDDPNRQAGIIDTEAEVLWKMNRFDEAIEVIERALSIEPDNQYFKNQKEKFIESRKTASQST